MEMEMDRLLGCPTWDDVQRLDPFIYRFLVNPFASHCHRIHLTQQNKRDNCPTGQSLHQVGVALFDASSSGMQRQTDESKQLADGELQQ